MNFSIIFLALIFGHINAETTVPITPDLPDDLTAKTLPWNLTTPTATPTSDQGIPNLTLPTWTPSHTTDYIETTPDQFLLVTTTMGTDGKVHCQLNTTQFIENQDQLNTLIGCQVIDNSLFITGGNEVTSFYPLSSLETVMGYLVITHVTAVPDMTHLKNLSLIEGNDFYLNQYSIFIEDNRQTTNHNVGLCYADLINWTSIIQNGNQLVEDNRDGCPTCHSQCLNNQCYGSGPRNCQFCQNFLSGITCVSECPYGTTLDSRDNFCQEFIPLQPDNIIVMEINPISINLKIDIEQLINGVLLEYILWRNETIIRHWIVSPDNNDIDLFFLDTNLTPMTNYSYSVVLINSVGQSPPSDLIIVETDESNDPPPSPLNFNVNQTTFNSALLTWDAPTLNHSRITGYQLEMYKYNFMTNYADYLYTLTLDNVNQFVVNNLSSYNRYIATIKTLTQYNQSENSNEVIWISPTGVPCPPLITYQTNFENFTFEWNDNPEGDCPQRGNIYEYSFRIESNETGQGEEFTRLTPYQHPITIAWELLTPGIIYKIIGQSRTSANYSNWSDPILFESQFPPTTTSPTTTTTTTTTRVKVIKSDDKFPSSITEYLLIFLPIIVVIIIIIGMVIIMCNRRHNRAYVQPSNQTNENQTIFKNPLYYNMNDVEFGTPNGSPDGGTVNQRASQNFYKENVPLNMARELNSPDSAEVVYDRLGRPASGDYGFP